MKTARKVHSMFELVRECEHNRKPELFELQYGSEVDGRREPSMTAYKKVLPGSGEPVSMPIVFCPKCRTWAHLENGVPVIGGARPDINVERPIQKREAAR